MSSSAPQNPILPVTAINSSSAVPNDPPAAASIQFFSRLAESARQSICHRRPWSVLLNRSAFSQPESISDATSRIRKNFKYFKINYFMIIALVLTLFLLTNPFSLIALLALFSAWSFLYLFRPSHPPLIMFGRQFSDVETLGCLILTTFFVVFLTSVGSILMSALAVGAGIVGAHGAFRQTEDLFLEEHEGGWATAGLLSFSAGANPSTAVQTGPSVAARV